MGILSLFLIALGLSMDAFAVSISNGMCFQNFRRKDAFFTALAFGFFQSLMPTIGFFAGRTFSDAISAFDHWVALLLLALIGGKMVLDGIRDLRAPDGEGPDTRCPRSFTLNILLLQAIATSIDAFAVGISFAIMQVSILVAAGFIGLVTFLCCLAGAALGKRFGLLLGHRAEVFGGIILIAIGLRIFLEHTFG